MDIQNELKKTRDASASLIGLSEQKVNDVLLDLSRELLKHSHAILEANKKDLARMDQQDPKYDRLLLSEERLQAISDDIKNVANLDSPLNIVLENSTHELGFSLEKITVPLGVVGVIYEARPNVTFDVFALCFKSGNACVLKGGSDAHDSNSAIVDVIHSVLKKHGIATEIVYLAPAGRDSVKDILDATDYIDIIIPRGSQGLINFVREHASVPVIETGAGIVHTYFDVSGDEKKCADIVFNAKTRRPSVCNALDTLLVHKDRVDDVYELVQKCEEKQVEIFADERSFDALDRKYPDELLHKAKPEDFGTEFLSFKMSIKVVEDLEEALGHIAKYSSKHSESIVAENGEVVEQFLKRVDAAAVYANVSTAFTDGAQFGLGAEIGISTQKLHARGPMGLRELTSYKWLVRGDGQVR